MKLVNIIHRWGTFCYKLSFYSIHKRMSSSSPAKICQVSRVTPELAKYEEAIRKLNSLQTNTSILDEAKRKLELGINRNRNVLDTLKYLQRVGIEVDSFDGKVIHISGTKGKGSTASLTESLLRSVPYRTGLFVSPHLTSVRERIAINGAPLPLATFVDYFWLVYNQLYQFKENENDMPSYFKFLTVMALKVFLIEKVDVAIVEVGIGGELDCTNVFKTTPIVGITSIGLDHISILGDSVEKIAWQKAGIMKRGCRAFTIPDHKESVLHVLLSRAKEKQCNLEVVPDLSEYPWNTGELSVPQKLNSSLALQLAKAWDVWNNNHEHIDYNRLDVTEREKKAVQECTILGRCQVLPCKELNATFFLDGAHTIESLEVAKSWFLQTSSRKNRRILIFNVTGERSPRPLLEILSDCHFSEAIFTTNNVSSKVEDLPADFIQASSSLDKAFLKAQENMKIWESLCREGGDSIGRAVPDLCEALAAFQQGPAFHPPPDVLVTGSLHLVGTLLSLLQPS